MRGSAWVVRVSFDAQALSILSPSLPHGRWSDDDVVDRVLHWHVYQHAQSANASGELLLFELGHRLANGAQILHAKSTGECTLAARHFTVRGCELTSNEKASR